MFTVLSVVYTQLRIVILHQVVISPEGAMYQHNDFSDNYVHFIYIMFVFSPLRVIVFWKEIYFGICFRKEALNRNITAKQG